MSRTDHILTEIAREHLRIATLETRNADSLDFHDVSVWQVRDALAAAHEAGRRHVPRLMDAAERVIDRWERGDLAEAVRALAEAVATARAT